MAMVAIGLRMHRARVNGEPRRRVLVIWSSIGWMFVTSMILLVPRHTEITDGKCSFDLNHVAAFAYDFERLLNVALFVPAGLLCLYLGRSSRQRAALAAWVLAMPPLFEWLQSTSLVGRTCTATDVVDNWTGALLGMAVAWAVTAVAATRGRD